MSKKNRKKERFRPTERQKKALLVISDWAQQALELEAVPLCCILNFVKDGKGRNRVLTPIAEQFYPELVVELREAADQIEKDITKPATPEPSAN